MYQSLGLSFSYTRDVSSQSGPLEHGVEEEIKKASYNLKLIDINLSKHGYTSWKMVTSVLVSSP